MQRIKENPGDKSMSEGEQSPLGPNALPPKNPSPWQFCPTTPPHKRKGDHWGSQKDRTPRPDG